MLLFTRRMLRTDQVMPRVDRLLLAMVALYLVTPLFYAFALPLFSRLAVYFNLTTAVVVLGVALAGRSGVSAAPGSSSRPSHC